ncbi:MAG: pectate lyase [Micromonosporaceae bacterium]
MPSVFRNGRRLAAVLAAAGTLVAASLLVSTPAHAAVLFSDDFDQPTVNVWLAGGSWSVATEDGSRVYKQSSTTNFPYAQAGSGSGTGTSVTARVKPTSPLGPTNLVALTGKTSDPNNLYYVAFRGARLEVGQQAWGHNIPLASTPFTANTGTWYTLTLSFLVAGTVTGSVSGPGGASATVSAADPGGTRPGDQVGFWMNSASASFDNIVLRDQTVPPPPPSTPPTCPVAITFKVGAEYGTMFTATVTFQNLTSTAIGPPWTITWQFTDGQVLQGMFNAYPWNQRGAVVTAHSPTWFPTVAPGATSNPPFGFQATGPGLGHPPVNVTFNGTPCAISFS